MGEVEARWVSGVFSRVVAVNVEIVVGGNSFTLGPSMGVNVEKPSGPTNDATDCANMDTIRLRWGSKSSCGVCWISMSQITYDNTNRNTTLSEAQGVSLRITFGMIVRVVYHDLCLGGKALAKRENVGLDLTKSNLCPSFVEELTAKGMGLRVADSHTGNHREDGFTPLETIRMFLGIIGSRSLKSLKGRPWSQRGGYVISMYA
ncbi:hypothetical protein Tco_1177855 [Tanacetum coccineum]